MPTFLRLHLWDFWTELFRNRKEGMKEWDRDREDNEEEEDRESNLTLKPTTSLDFQV